MSNYKGWQMTFTEFNNRYEINMTECETYISAYYATEDEHINLTGDARYSGYNSFRNVRSRNIKDCK